MPLPPDYIAALGNVAKAFAAYEADTGATAVLVGGAAAAIHTGGTFMSADFDVVAASDEAFERAMASTGFLSDPRAGHGLGGWYHPDFPSYAVEQVSGGYFDGKAERARCLRITVRDGGDIILPAIEDMIADRLGQHEAGSGDTAMLEQAKALFTMAEGLDATYLVRRIHDEGGNPALLGLHG